MKPWPTNGPIIRSKSQYEREANNSRHSLARSWAKLCERKKNLLDSAGVEISLSAQLVDASFAHDFSGTQHHQPITDPSGIDELMNREHQGPARRRMTLQQSHDIASLSEIESVKRFIKHQ